MSLFEKNELEEFNEADWEENIFKRICHSRLFRYTVSVAMIIITLVATSYGVYYKVRLEEAHAHIKELEEMLIKHQDSSKEDVVTMVIIEEKLKEIAELDTASFEYSGKITEQNSRTFFNTEIKIPGTKSSIEVTYNGVIKVGYDIQEISYRIDEQSKTIYMTLPKPKVFDNYIKHDSLIFIEKDNPFNPISSEIVNNYLMRIEEVELKRAENDGIYEKAEKQMKNIIRNYFAEFSEYEIAFL